MFTFLQSEFIRLSKFELELPQTTDQSEVVNLVSRRERPVSTRLNWTQPTTATGV